MDDVEKYLKALLMLKLQNEGDGDAPKPDLLLTDAGFSAKEVAALTGRSVAAVRKAISRARTKEN